MEDEEKKIDAVGTQAHLAASKTSAIDESPNAPLRSAGAEENNVGSPPQETGTAPDPFLVTWTGPSDPLNPLNWLPTAKWTVTLLTSLGGTVTLMASTMMAPALPTASLELNLDPATAQLALSIFPLSFAFGPMVLAPMTEVFGRRPVFLLSGCFFVAWSVVCGFARTEGVMLAGRFFTGLGGSAEFAVSGPVLSDVWPPSQRGHSFAISTVLPLLGPALGPILGGLLTGSIGWRWIFHVLAIFDALLLLTALFLLPETHHPSILHAKAAQLRRQTGNAAYYAASEREHKSLAHEVAAGLLRPAWMLATQPVVQVMSVISAYNFGTMYIMHSTFASLFIDRYSQSVTVSGLHYLAIVAGFIAATQLGGPLMDRVYAALKTRKGGAVAPEYRVPLMLPGAVLIPAGLMWYGWAAETRAHWVVVDLGAAVAGMGFIGMGQAAQAYVMDSFPGHVASAIAASQLPRGVAAFGFPAYAPALYARLGYGWGNSVLALGVVVLGWPAPVLLWRYGAWLRGKGRAYR